MQKINRVRKATLFLVILVVLSGCSNLNSIPGLSLLDQSTALSTNFTNSRKNHSPNLIVKSTHTRRISSMPYTEEGEFILTPGLYEARVKSFCLRMGTHAPSSGDGYVSGKMQGRKSKVINSILKSYSSKKNNHIPQKDVQALLWAILADTPYKNMSSRVKSTALKLLSNDTNLLVDTSVSLISEKLSSSLVGSLPGELKKTLELKRDIQRLISDQSSNYRQLEKLAILDGAAIIDRPEYKRGDWSKGDGNYYIRYMPSGYQNMLYQVYVPEESGATKFDGTKLNSVPANTGAQRLGMTNPTPELAAPIKKSTCPGSSDPNTRRTKAAPLSKGGWEKQCKKVANCIADSFDDITKVGGPAKRCIRKGKFSSKFEAYKKTSGKCNKHKEGKVKGKDGKDTGPASNHADGKGIDTFLTPLTNNIPGRRNSPWSAGSKEEKAGNKVKDWAIKNHKDLNISDVIWNEKIYSKSNNWKEKDYSGKNKHYDHVHISCN